MSKTTVFLVAFITSAFVGYFAGGLAADYQYVIASAKSSDARSEYIDLTSPSVQTFWYGNLAIAELEQREHLTGIKFEGRIINLTSVPFETVTFELDVAARTKTFTISRISPGDSTGFSVYVPDLSPSESARGRIRYQTSMVHYLRT